MWYSIDGAYVIHWLIDDTCEAFAHEEDWEAYIAEIENQGNVEGIDFYAYYDLPQW